VGGERIEDAMQCQVDVIVNAEGCKMRVESKTKQKKKRNIKRGMNAKNAQDLRSTPKRGKYTSPIKSSATVPREGGGDPEVGRECIEGGKKPLTWGTVSSQYKARTWPAGILPALASLSEDRHRGHHHVSVRSAARARPNARPHACGSA